MSPDGELKNNRRDAPAPSYHFTLAHNRNFRHEGSSMYVCSYSKGWPINKLADDHIMRTGVPSDGP